MPEAPRAGVLCGGDLARAQRNLVQDAAWASIIGVLSGGVILVGFALSLGASPFVVGLLGAVPSLGALAQLPAIALIERVRRRKPIAVGLGLAERAVVVAIAFLPLLPDRTLALGILVAAEVAVAVLAAMSACAWNSWMHDLLPQHGMGGFFAQRLSWSTAVSLAGGLGAGLLVDHWPGTEPRHAYVVAFIGAGLAGFASSWFLARVPEPPMAPPLQVRPALLAVLRRPLRDAGFRRLVVFLSSWSFSTNLAAPFLSVYLLQQLSLGLGVVVALWAASQLANALTVGLWGRLSDRLSDKAILRCTAPMFLLCLVALPVAAGADGAMLPLLVLVHVAMGVATGGTALASGNIALRLAPPGQGTAFLAVVALCNAGAAGVAPILGGLAADWFAVRGLDLVVDWTAPGSSVAVTPLHLRHWEFFFVLAAVTGLYALHSLSRVPGTGPGRDRILVRDLMLEAARTLRSLSTVAGLRANAGFPFGRLVDGRPARIRRSE